MTHKVNNIPSRQKCIDKGHPYIGGAIDIIDDDLQLTQSQINSIVLGGSITPNLTRTPSVIFVDTASNVTLVASITTPADSIKIFKNGVSEPIATGSGTNLSHTDNVTASERGNVQYYAEFKIGGLTKRQPASGFVNVQAVDKMYTGAGTTYAGTTMNAETSPHGVGDFTKQITTVAGDYIFIEVPDNFKLTSIKLVSTYDTSLAFTEIESTRAGYKAYKNNETRGAGTYTYKFTIANI